MDEGYRFIESVLRYPIEECNENLCSLKDTVDDDSVEVVFSDTQIAPGLARQFYLREGLIPQFGAVARGMNDQGLVLKVEDAFRDREMQKRLALKEAIIDQLAKRLMWECRDELPSPSFITKRLRVLIAHCPKTGTHMSGSAIDISVLNRDDGKEMDRGAPYLELSELTPMSSPFADEQCRTNRQMINSIMREHNFVAYPYEFWHYSSRDAFAELLMCSDVSGRYGPVDMDAESGSVTAIENPMAPLNTDDEIVQRIELAINRLPKRT